MDIVKKINDLKKKRNAIVLAHNYMTPDIVNGVADFTGDSLTMALAAQDTDADIIVVAGVKFMATTAKVLNPKKKILSPALSGCSLASSIKAKDVRAIRKKNPGIPVVAYVNVTADVMAEADYACTSANAQEVVRYAGYTTGKVIMVPDKYLAENTQIEVPEVEIITYDGSCEVHEKFEWDRKKLPAHTKVFAHPECRPSVLDNADFVGSTGALKKEILTLPKDSSIVLLTECSMSANIQEERPDINFTGSCKLCPYMQMVTLENIRSVLALQNNEILLDEDIIKRAKKPIMRMLELSK